MLDNCTENPIPQKWAVLIGVEYYERPGQATATARKDGLGNEITYGDLGGCINDVLAMERYLIETIRVDQRRITKLLAPCPGRAYLSEPSEGSYRLATHSNILDALRVPDGATSGDFMYIHFSGHGGRATTVFPDLKREADAEDQVLVPCDIASGGQYVRDLELGVLLQDIVDAGLVLTVVLDCCYSGGAVRGGGDPELGATRGIAEVYESDLRRDRPINYERVMEWGLRPAWMSEPEGLVVIAACEEHQKARETRVAGSCHGLLTHCLLGVLQNYSADISSQALFEQVCFKVRDSCWDQNPYLIGDDDRFFFSRKVRARLNALIVTRALTDLNKDPEDRCVHLGGGKVHGVEKGSEYSILPVDFDLSKPIEKHDVLATVKVTMTMSDTSVASFLRPREISSWEKFKHGCVAVLRNLPLEKKSKVRFTASDDAVKRTFVDEWHRHNGDQTWLSLVGDDDSSPFFDVSVDDVGNFQIQDRSGNSAAAIGGALRPLSATPLGGTDSMPILIRALEHLARFRMTKELANPGTRPGTGPTLISATLDPARKEVKHPQGGRQLPPADIKKKKNWTYEVEEKTGFQITIQNLSSQPLACVILNCAAEFGVERLFPRKTPYYTLNPGETKETSPIWIEIAEELRQVAARGEPVVDTFKIFACSSSRNLDALTLPSLKEMSDDMMRRGRNNGCESTSIGLQELLAELETSRKACSGGEDAEVDWETVNVKVQALPVS